MILAGDIGGTKTILGLFEVEDGALRPVRQESYPSREHRGLEEIVTKFMAAAPAPVAAACFGVAGPVVEGQSVTPNLPWVVNSHALAQALRADSVTLINDLEATAYGVLGLPPEETVTLNEGAPPPANIGGNIGGNIGVIAAGTGLGIAGLFWDGKRHIPSASEGGHVDFAPRDQLEIDLLRHLLSQYDRVSVERIVSGPGLYNIYQFLRASGHGEESPEVVRRLAGQDPSSVISAAALAGECDLCVEALDLFTAVYGATAGNLALTLKAVGGIYVGGGIAPKIVAKIKDGTFINAFMNKGRLSPLLAQVPVRVVMNSKTALLGAARAAADLSPPVA